MSMSQERILGIIFQETLYSQNYHNNVFFVIVSPKY